MVCEKCGSGDLVLQKKGYRMGLYCAECGRFVKWAVQSEIDAVGGKKDDIYNFARFLQSRGFLNVVEGNGSAHELDPNTVIELYLDE